MKTRFFLPLALLMNLSCSHYAKLAHFNTPENVDGHTRIFNEKLNLSTLHYGDVKFAFSDKEFKTFHPKKKPAFKKIIFYGQTFIAPFYNYYLLEESEKITNTEYLFFEYPMQDKTFVLAVSKYTPEADVEFLRNHISSFLK